MLFSLLYLLVRAIFRLAPPGDEFEREVEIMVLRHQVRVLRRKDGRPKLRRIDKLLLAAASRILPIGSMGILHRHPGNAPSLAPRTGPSEMDPQAEAMRPSTD